MSPAAAACSFELHTGAAWESLEPTPDGTQARARLLQRCLPGRAWCPVPPLATSARALLLPGTASQNLPAPLPRTPPVAQVRVRSAKGDEGLFDFLIVSTGLLTDARLRPELSTLAGQIATWGSAYVAPAGAARNPLLDAHPYLVRSPLRRCSRGPLPAALQPQLSCRAAAAVSLHPRPWCPRCLRSRCASAGPLV